MLKRLFIIMCLYATLAGCATTPPPALAVNAQRDSALLICRNALHDLDQLTRRQVGTLQGERLPGTPWLRSTRLTEHYATQPALSDAALQALLTRMSSEAQTALLLESSNLPASILRQWQTTHDIEAITDFVAHCSQQLIAAQLRNPSATRAWLQQLPADNDYSTLARVAGLYPISALLFRNGVLGEQRRLTQLWPQLSDAHWTAYTPQGAPIANSHETSSHHNFAAVTHITHRLDALGLPLLDAAEQQRLLQRHAPVWLLNADSPANIPGQPHWQSDQLRVDPTAPTIYSYLSVGLFNQQPLLQLNYLAWFSERPAKHAFDLLSGQHDAVLFRVNLDLSGRIIAFDSIHLCGCWYTLFLPEQQPWHLTRHLYEEPLLAYRVNSAPQMAIFLQADDHQIVKLAPATPLMNSRAYQQLPFANLLQLPYNKHHRAVFDPAGYVAGSERSERWLFWPMGIKNPGALRRPEDHAIQFVGKAYFDDPQLLETLGVGQSVGNTE